MSAPRIFDQQHYQSLNSSRAAVVSALLAELKGPLDIRTAVDVGCGLGYFSGLLTSLALEVTAVDGRSENVDEAARRHPGVSFHTYNAEDPAIRTLGKFDLVFCFGLLYHLENPLMAIRHLHSMADKLLLVEGVILSGEEPVMALVDEEIHDDQGVNYIAFYPTESCLVKMLYASGMKYVYGLKSQPRHPDYGSANGTARVRTVLAAAASPLTSASLEFMPAPSTAIKPWDPSAVARRQNALEKLRRALKRRFGKS